MKKLIILALAALMLMLSACTGQPDNTETLPTPSGEAAEPAEESPAPTTPPDYSNIDFSGFWTVSQIIDSNGDRISEGEMAWLGADFMLELLPGNTYFVYNAAGVVLGQGTYAIAQTQLILTAGEQQTMYDIIDADTLECLQPDSSITVMKRAPREDQGILEGDTGDTGSEPEGEGDYGSEPEGDIGSEGDTGVIANAQVADGAKKT